MRKRTKAFFRASALAAAWLALSAPAALAIGKPGAIVAFVTGDVRVKHAPDVDFTPLYVNDLLYAGDTIQTGPVSQASVILKSGVEVRLNESTLFGVYPKGPGQETMTLVTGQVWARVLVKMAKLTVSTPAAICAIRGTEADIQQGDRLTVKVYEGHVDVSNRFGARSLSAGEMTQVMGPHASPRLLPRRLANPLREKWQDAITAPNIDELLRRLAPGAGGPRKVRIKVREGGRTREVEIILNKK